MLSSASSVSLATMASPVASNTLCSNSSKRCLIMQTIWNVVSVEFCAGVPFELEELGFVPSCFFDLGSGETTEEVDDPSLFVGELSSQIKNGMLPSFQAWIAVLRLEIHALRSPSCHFASFSIRSSSSSSVLAVKPIMPVPSMCPVGHNWLHRSFSARFSSSCGTLWTSRRLARRFRVCSSCVSNSRNISNPVSSCMSYALTTFPSRTDFSNRSISS
mmetsp:Transcript_18072/g.39390  ORF Transcript_18072/g.39390 Transcript_18072/m.39390 type:complete len:217 (+) Transcript_18072:1201-1851(+)